VRRGLAAFAVLLVPALASAQRNATFRVVPNSGGTFDGELQSISPSGDISIRGRDETIALSDLVEIQRVGDPPAKATPSPGGFVRLRTGTTLDCRKLAGHGDAIEFEPRPQHAAIRIALTELAALRPGPAAEDDGGFTRALENPSSTKDLVFAWDRGGASIRRFSMRVDRIDGDELQVEAGGMVRGLPLSRVYGVVFGDDNGAAPDPLPRPTVTIRGSFGEPLCGRLLGWDRVHCRLALAEGAEITLPCDTVAGITVDSGRVAFLSDLEPAAIDQVPALNRPKPWLRDRTPIGPGLELGGIAYSRGLCLVPRTRLRYDVTGEWNVFEATVGIDDRSNDLAHAVIRVLADDRVVFDSGPVQHGDEPMPITIDLTGVEQLTLETDFGENLDFGDHCVFAGARLRKN